MREKRRGEAAFLKEYREEAYEKLSLTVDVLVFTLDKDFRLELLLKKREIHPYKGCWALPGGFVGVSESLEEAALRILEEKTGLSELHMEQLYTFGAKDRDPRMRIVSVAYLVILPRDGLYEVEEGSQFFQLSYRNSHLSLEGGESLGEEELAFDHAEMIGLALERMRGKLHYTDIALQFLKDRGGFTLYELQKVYEAIDDRTYDIANFRRYFKGRYEETGAAAKTGETSTEFSKRPSSYYKMK